ncbi:hypothetical protein B0T21DRAFT_406655 [Apiosordaria backusii]|uniref:F-box domain-containing protein n=1 Tax=Apiosordaria backusii TaxID=314023 RepID=A0AA40EYX9_9PEZI|nr:hypothetical protein B0T21DRAFT_406655 [Apiosordaria backusii]
MHSEVLHDHQILTRHQRESIYDNREMGQTCWQSLPEEIQAKILNEVTRDRKFSIAHYASVCRRWQQAIEKVTFARLKVTKDRLDNFDKITASRRHLVKYIWLSIELPRYSCGDCNYYVARSPRPPHDYDVFVVTLGCLLQTLSRWESGDGIELDVSANSPSNWEHCFKYIRVEPDILPEDEPECPLTVADLDNCHGWEDGRPARLPSTWSVEETFRIYGRLRLPMPAVHFWQRIPPVPVITSLILRRQTRRGFHQLDLDYLVSHRLVNLRQLHREPWKGWDLDIQQQITTIT